MASKILKAVGDLNRSRFHPPSSLSLCRQPISLVWQYRKIHIMYVPHGRHALGSNLSLAQALKLLYGKILRDLKKLPAASAYRKYTEEVVNTRLGHVESVRHSESILSVE